MIYLESSILEKKMKNITMSILILAMLQSCSMSSISKNKIEKRDQNQSVTKKSVINVDEELLLNSSVDGLRNSDENIIHGSIYLNDNDEVSFKGDSLEEKSPISITIGEKDMPKFTGKVYTLKTKDLHHGDTIEMRDSEGKVFLEMEFLEL